MRRVKRGLSQQDLRDLASAGLTVTRYDAAGERATVRQLAPEGPERRRDFIRRLTSTGEETKASEGS